ncbi:MAG TPA: hypothetical protein VNK81_03950 [Thermodesulfobacteriota bacterium]|nr:hypothetical protein [Thermodesulfobacteriota bacterium]
MEIQYGVACTDYEWYRYYTANVLKTIEETIRGRRKAGREVLVFIYSL